MTLFAPVTVYTLPVCPSCTQVKAELDLAGIAYEAVDLSTNDEARAYVTGVLKAKAAPVIVTDTHEPILGYDREKLVELIDYLTSSETGV